MLTTKLPLVDGKGTVIGTMGISREITERKRVEQELQEYRQQLEELVRKRTAELARANELLERDIAARRIVEEELTQKARELAKANAELQNLSLTDPLTGLYNRRGFMALMEHRIRLAARTEESFSIGFLDLDDLKQINDSFGHQEGNVALVETANALRDCFRVSDILARVGGDEFALCIADANEEEIAQRIQEQFDRRNAAPGRSYSLAYSVGIVACHPGENWDIEALLARADALMYRQKQSKRRLRNGASSGI